MHLNRLFGRVSLSMFPFHSPGTGEEMGKLQDDGVRKIPDRGVNATKSKAGFHNNDIFYIFILGYPLTYHRYPNTCMPNSHFLREIERVMIIQNVALQLQFTCTSKTGKLGVIKVKFQRH